MNQPGAGQPPVDLGDSGHCDRAARLLASVDTQLRCVVQLVHQATPLVSTEELRQELVTSLLSTAACGRGLTAPALLSLATAQLVAWAVAEQDFRELPRLAAGLPAGAEDARVAIQPAAALASASRRRSLSATAATRRHANA